MSWSNRERASQGQWNSKHNGHGAALYLPTCNSGLMDLLLNAMLDLEQRVSALIKDAQTNEDKAALLSKVTLAWISQSHYFPFECTYRPYLQFGAEYVAVDQTNGSIGPNGGKLSYSLPVYGDFLTDMVLITNWSEISCTPGTLATLPNDLLDVPGDESGGTNLTLDKNTAVASHHTFSVDGGVTWQNYLDIANRTYYTAQYRYWDSLTGSYVTPL